MKVILPHETKVNTMTEQNQPTQDIRRKHDSLINHTSSISDYSQLETDLTIKAQDKPSKQAYKQVNKAFIELATGRKIEDIEKENISKVREFETTQTRLKNVANDIKTKAYNIPLQNKQNPILYNKDNNSYLALNKQVKYKDYSVLQVLKVLWKQHKISKFLYKDSIKRAKTGKQIKTKVAELITAYYRTIKTSSGKNTLKKLKQIEQLSHRAELTTTHKGNTYKVILKRNPKAFSYSLLNEELSNKINADNSILSIL